MSATASLPDSAHEQAARALFDGLWDRHHEAVYRYCHHFFMDEHRAADVCQKVFLDAYRALLDGRFDGHNERSWLFRNAVRKCIDDKKLGWGHFVRGSIERMFPEIVTGEKFQSRAGAGHDSRPHVVRAGREALTDEGADPSRILDHAIVAARVQSVLSLLTPMDRATILAYEHDGQSCQEIADAFGTTRTAVKLRLWRGRERFRQAWIGRYGAYPQEVAA